MNCSWCQTTPLDSTHYVKDRVRGSFCSDTCRFKFLKNIRPKRWGGSVVTKHDIFRMEHALDPTERERILLDIAARKHAAEEQESYAMHEDPKRNIFGIEEWRTFGECYDVDFDKAPPCPWDDAFLDSPCPFYKRKTIRETHFLFLGIEKFCRDLTIMEWYQRCIPENQLQQPRFEDAPDPCYMNESFATRETCAFRWYLLLREVAPRSIGKPFHKQKDMLPREYEVPPAIVEVTKNLLSFYKTGYFWVNRETFARCASTDSYDNRIHVGHFTEKGLRIIGRDDDWNFFKPGIAASRKHP